MCCSFCIICALTMMALLWVGASKDSIDSNKELVHTEETNILTEGARTIDIAAEPFKNPLPAQVAPCGHPRVTASELQATQC
jgi:hypothetical protein